MNGIASWAARARAALAGRVERLGRRLETLSLQLRDVLSRLAGRAVSGAVCDAVRDALGLPPAPRRDPRRSAWFGGGHGDPYRRPGDAYDGDPDDADGRGRPGAGRADPWRYGEPERDDDDSREADPPLDPPPRESWAARLRRSVGVGWQVVCARLKLRPTLVSVPAALWLGVAAAAAAFAGGRAVAAGVGLAGSALALTDLAAARDAPA